jgi:D-alanine-D-alanine ligase-like ATP-grasp enzyme
MKPGGYSDSGADIAYSLQRSGLEVVLPIDAGTGADPRREFDWVFPDTAKGIEHARSRGADTLWANTVLFEGHPLQALESTPGPTIIGQRCAVAQRFDDKFYTNRFLRQAGIHAVPSVLVGRGAYSDDDAVLDVDSLSYAELQRLGLDLPLVVKPIRGRGSQGVARVSSLDELRDAAGLLLESSALYGNRVMVEPYLPGEETTVTVLPPGIYSHGTMHEHWALPAVRRINHIGGVAPYSGVVAVVDNSVAVSVADESPALREAKRQCEQAAALIEARAPVRIDCRTAPDGTVFLFDINVKPNMTGPGRPGRERQSNLCALAAREFGWSYDALLVHVVRSRVG